MRAAIEQRHSELLLERLDLVTDGRRRDEQLFGGDLEAQARGSHLEGLEKLE